MLHDYLRSCWRGVLHNKVATFINVSGLALGLAVFFALIFYVHREFSWDAHWDDADRIYTLRGRQESPTGNSAAIISSAPYVIGTRLQSHDPDAIEAYARVYGSQNTFVIDGREFPERYVNYVEPGLLDVVQIDTLEGSLQDVFADPRAIALHTRSVEALFGAQSALDKTLTVKSQQGGETDFVVRAIYDIPGPSILAGMQYLALLDPALPPVPNAGWDVWNQLPGPPAQSPFDVTHYFKLSEDADAARIEADLRAFMDENRYQQFGDSSLRFLFRGLQDVYLSPDPFTGGDNVQRLWLFAAIGVLVLLISGCNFVMLATLRSIDRMREVGIRKTLGGAARQLMGQYLVDASCLTFVAAAIAVLLLEFALPKMQVLLQLPQSLDLMTWRNMGLVLVVVAAFTLISGAYPAWLMARGKPAALFRNSSGGVVGRGNGLRKLLVGIQFAIVIVLLLASAVVQQQIRYSQNRGRGYSLEDVMALRLNSIELMQKTPTLVNELNRVPGVGTAAVGSLAPGTIFLGSPPMLRRTADDGSVIEAPIQQTSVGVEYFSVLSVPLLAGREFTAAIEGTLPVPVPGVTTPPPPQRNILLNVSATKDLGFATPELALEQLLETEFTLPTGEKFTQSLRVIGVVIDTQFASVMLPPVSQFYGYSAQNGFLAVKLEPNADAAAVRADMETTWRGVMGDAAFLPLSPEQMEGNTLRREQFEARIIIGSTVLAMIIALLGLYGLVAATVVKRVKEIGVRKVMGAERTTLVGLLLWQFSKPVAVANLIAWPAGFWAVTQWMQRFPYRLDMQVIVVSGLLASLAALLIAWLTVGFMAAKAASANPVLALRNE